VKPLPLRHRIPAALRLQPMTEGELSRCLSVSQQSVNECIARLPVKPIGWRRRGRYTAAVWGYATPFRQPQRGQP
jgi:hypothetical protein